MFGQSKTSPWNNTGGLNDEIDLGNLAAGCGYAAMAADPAPLPLSDDQLDRITAGGSVLIDTPGRNDVVATNPGPASIGIFNNVDSQSGTLVDTPGVAQIVPHGGDPWIVISVK